MSKKIELKTTHSMGKILQAMFEQQRVTIRAAAKIAGVAPSQVHSWLNGAHPHNMAAVLKLCRALDVDFQYLLTGSPSGSVSTELRIEELFEIESMPALSGLFLIEAKRLKKKAVRR